MEAAIETVSAWSYGLAGFVFAAFAIYHATGWRTGGLRSRALFLVVALSAVWGIASLAYVLTEYSGFLTGSLFADLVRYG